MDYASAEDNQKDPPSRGLTESIREHSPQCTEQPMGKGATTIGMCIISSHVVHLHNHKKK